MIYNNARYKTLFLSTHMIFSSSLAFRRSLNARASKQFGESPAGFILRRVSRCIFYQYGVEFTNASSFTLCAFRSVIISVLSLCILLILGILRASRSGIHTRERENAIGSAIIRAIVTNPRPAKGKPGREAAKHHRGIRRVVTSRRIPYVRLLLLDFAARRIVAYLLSRRDYVIGFVSPEGKFLNSAGVGNGYFGTSWKTYERLIVSACAMMQH